MREQYLGKVAGGRWAISRFIGHRTVYLIENTALDDENDAHDILRALGLATHEKHLDEFFPRNKKGERCPTLELMELCNVLDPTNPVYKREQGEVGV